MVDFQMMRENMVKSQIVTNNVTSLSLIRAFEEIPRERFVPNAFATVAYFDESIELDLERYLLSPMVFAKLVTAAGIRSHETVLDIGSGFGYSSAILSFLAKKVFGLESKGKMTEIARENLEDFEIFNLDFETAPLKEGWPKKAPYDAIFIEGVVEEIPEELFKQLKEGGRLLTLEKVGLKGPAQGVMYVKTEKSLTRKRLFEAHGATLLEFKKKRGFTF